jgi:phosphoribosyl 1,2-cyclic phosphate phosphodiesterase
MSALHFIFLGTGTSQGVPRIGCSCATCSSLDPRDHRTRCSLYVESPEMRWVIDTGPDFRQQCLRERIEKLDAALFTHAHTDHIMGFDDLRPFSYGRFRFPVYGSRRTLDQLAAAFSFAFNEAQRFPGYLHPDPREAEGPFLLGETEVIPLLLPHGSIESVGYLFRREGRPLLAYLTDCKSVPGAVRDQVRGVEHLVLDALREKEHPTHMSIGEACEVVETIQPRHAWLTHLCHDHLHAEMDARLPGHIRVAFDGLRLSAGV